MSSPKAFDATYPSLVSIIILSKMMKSYNSNVLVAQKKSMILTVYVTHHMVGKNQDEKPES